MRPRDVGSGARGERGGKLGGHPAINVDLIFFFLMCQVVSHHTVFIAASIHSLSIDAIDAIDAL